MCAGYSKWTNSSFRGPLLFSAASCIAGNLVYCYAYDSRFLWALYAARLLTGLGALSSKTLLIQGVGSRQETDGLETFWTPRLLRGVGARGGHWHVANGQ